MRPRGAVQGTRAGESALPAVLQIALRHGAWGPGFKLPHHRQLPFHSTPPDPSNVYPGAAPTVRGQRLGVCCRKVGRVFVALFRVLGFVLPGPVSVRGPAIFSPPGGFALGAAVPIAHLILAAVTMTPGQTVLPCWPRDNSNESWPTPDVAHARLHAHRLGRSAHPTYSQGSAPQVAGRGRVVLFYLISYGRFDGRPPSLVNRLHEGTGPAALAVGDGGTILAA